MKPLADTQNIHSLYQDLYLTDLKNDLGDIELELKHEKHRNIIKDDKIKELKS